MKHEVILTNAFQLLAIATSVATFLPALIYQNLIKFADELFKQSENTEFRIALDNNDPDQKRQTNRDWVAKHLAYSVSLDIIQFTMMILVVGTAICNFLLYVHATNDSKTILIVINIVWILFLVLIIILWLQALKMVQNEDYIKYWQGGSSFVHTLYFIIIGFILSEIGAGLLLYCKNGSGTDNIELFMVSISVFIVLGTILVWLFPLFKYRPVSDRILNAIKKITKNSEER